MGYLVQANAEIRDEESRFLRRKLESWRLRRPVLLIDWMLAELEELNLHGKTEVPPALMGSLRVFLDFVNTIPEFNGGLIADLMDALFEGSILKLMDALFELQERLLQGSARRARCARPAIWKSSPSSAPGQNTRTGAAGLIVANT